MITKFGLMHFYFNNCNLGSYDYHPSWYFQQMKLLAQAAVSWENEVRALVVRRTGMADWTSGSIWRITLPMSWIFALMNCIIRVVSVGKRRKVAKSEVYLQTHWAVECYDRFLSFFYWSSYCDVMMALAMCTKSFEIKLWEIWDI